jgi:hypothetical protein
MHGNMNVMFSLIYLLKCVLKTGTEHKVTT